MSHYSGSTVIVIAGSAGTLIVSVPSGLLESALIFAIFVRFIRLNYII